MIVPFSTRPLPAPRTLILPAILFALGVYAILSLRAELAPDAAVGVFSLRRIVATAAGGVVFWAILRRLAASPAALRGGAWQLFGMLLAAGVGVLGLRVVFGWLVVDEGLPLAQDIRWTLLWLGYLGLSTGLYLAHRLRNLSAASIAGAPYTESIDELTAALVSELSAADRAVLAERLAASTRYAEADPLDPAAEAKVVRLRGAYPR